MTLGQVKALLRDCDYIKFYYPEGEVRTAAYLQFLADDEPVLEMCTYEHDCIVYKVTLAKRAYETAYAEYQAIFNR